MLAPKTAAWSASTRRTPSSPGGRPGAATRRGPACTKRKSEPVAADPVVDVPRAASDPGRVCAKVSEKLVLEVAGHEVAIAYRRGRRCRQATDPGKIDPFLTSPMKSSKPTSLARLQPPC